MTLIIPIQRVQEEDGSLVGGKAFALSRLLALSSNIPKAICVSAEGYVQYVATTGLRERILLELNRKPFADMRWEEIWDASLRIRNMFLRTPIPAELADPIRSAVNDIFGKRAVVVRSSAPGEDSAKASFAGLHESFVNVRGLERILLHIRLVWSSLWSDAALLYRKELGLEVEKSTMAVLIQEFIAGDQSGVIFGMNPNNPSQAVIEAVYGLNAGLVDGTIEPDRYLLDRKTGCLLDHREPARTHRLLRAEEGTRLESLPAQFRHKPPLTEQESALLFRLAMEAESLFGSLQDIEWTFRHRTLHVLQSRPITTTSDHAPEDKRPWYLSLRRSLENLNNLRWKIEKELVPRMVEDTDRLRAKNLADLSDSELADEISSRKKLYENWACVYWEEFIPFAHGMRLFGQFYNNTVQPHDPFEFLELLGSTQLLSIERNRLLVKIAQRLRQDPQLMNALRNGASHPDPEFNHMLDRFAETLGITSGPMEEASISAYNKYALVPLLLQMAETPAVDAPNSPKNSEKLISQFFALFDGPQKEMAKELLDLGRASYRLRDDDNIYLGRIENQMKAALSEGQERIRKREKVANYILEPDDLIELLKNPGFIPIPKHAAGNGEIVRFIKARQMVGQPAGPGIAKGKARVILKQADLLQFRKGEILVCDALDPNMTFVVPLSSGIVERRGGMLIHGAIIAREYGLPCVTGVSQATSLIKTGSPLTVDGYLGIVVVE